MSANLQILAGKLSGIGGIQSVSGSLFPVADDHTVTEDNSSHA